MDIIGELCTLVERKKDLFCEYEEATLALLDCAPDDAEHYITLRGAKANELEAVQDEIELLCGAQPDAPVLLDCVFARLEFARVPSAYQCVYYSGQSVNSVIGRIQRTEEQVTARLGKLRDEAMAAIRQSRDLPKIRKYLSGLTEQPGGRSLTDNKA